MDFQNFTDSPDFPDLGLSSRRSPGENEIQDKNVLPIETLSHSFKRGPYEGSERDFPRPAAKMGGKCHPSLKRG